MTKIYISETGRALYRALINEREQEDEEEKDGSVWRLVYLDNATASLSPRPTGRQLSSLFSQLALAGLYRAEDNEFKGAWGSLRLIPEPDWNDEK